jgi:uncharacterized membrane protein YkoI
MLKPDLLFAAVLAAATLLLGGAALAQSPRAEAIGAPRAVAQAEATVKGKVLELELDYQKGRLVYDIEAISGARVHAVRVNAITGEIIFDKPHRLESYIRAWVDAAKFSAVRAAPTPLSELLAKVEAETRVKVRTVSLKKDRGQTFYQVELADAGRHVLIDPRTGATREGRIDD